MREVKEIKKELAKLNTKCRELQKELVYSTRQKKRTKGKTFSEYLKKFHWVIRIDRLNECDFAMAFGIKDRNKKLFSIIVGENSSKDFTEFLFDLENPNDKDLLTQLTTFLQNRICPESTNVFVGNKNGHSVPVFELGVGIEDWYEYDSKDRAGLLDEIAMDWPTSDSYYQALYDAETQDEVFELIRNHHDPTKSNTVIIDAEKALQNDTSKKMKKEESLIFDMIGSPTINIEFVAGDHLKFSSSNPDGKETSITLKDYQVERLKDFLNNQ